MAKIKTFEDAIVLYGPIDFASRHWPHQETWMGMLEVPRGWFPNWKVLDTALPVHHIYCNKEMRWPLMQALDAVHSRGHASLLRAFDGCFEIRPVRGAPSKPSAHSYGLAIDINAAENPLGDENGAMFYQPELVTCFTEFGFSWGGNFHRKDPMHLSYCWE